MGRSLGARPLPCPNESEKTRPAKASGLSNDIDLLRDGQGPAGTFSIAGDPAPRIAANLTSVANEQLFT